MTKFDNFSNGTLAINDKFRENLTDFETKIWLCNFVLVSLLFVDNFLAGNSNLEQIRQQTFTSFSRKLTKSKWETQIHGKIKTPTSNCHLNSCSALIWRIFSHASDEITFFVNIDQTSTNSNRFWHDDKNEELCPISSNYNFETIDDNS